MNVGSLYLLDNHVVLLLEIGGQDRYFYWKKFIGPHEHQLQFEYYDSDLFAFFYNVTNKHHQYGFKKWFEVNAKELS